MDALMTREQAAKILGVKLTFLKKEIRGGRLPQVRLGKKIVRIDPCDLQMYIDTWRVTVVETVAGASIRDGARPVNESHQVVKNKA
jgi:excisionase family DNA binding protein